MKPDLFGDFLMRFLGISQLIEEATRPRSSRAAPPPAGALETARRCLFELRGEARQLIALLGEEAAVAQAESAPGSGPSAAPAMPVLDHGRRPSWWQDTEVAILVTRLHRLVEIEQAVCLCRERFGAERAPSRSSLHRYWMKLDRLARGSRA